MSYFAKSLSISSIFLGCCAAVFVWLFSFPVTVFGQNSQNLPRPVELEPAIQFWVKVYTEVDTQSGFLHDADHLSVIYSAMPLDRKRIEVRREQIKDTLRLLATGKREGLTSEQQQILELWPADVDGQTLRAAAENVRWQLGQSNAFLAGYKRSGLYRNHITSVIEDKGLPAELIALPHVESSFNPSAYSLAAAAGMWQFTRATGQRFMRIDHIVDERMDPYISAEAAMSLLEYNYRVLGTWPLALTAYNHGAGGIARAVREMGTSDIEVIVANYKGRRFGFASRNFYAQFLAVNDVEKNSKKYFGDVQFETEPTFIEVEIDAYIDAEIFSKAAGLSLEQLRSDNPALRPIVWEGRKRIPKGYKVKIREGFGPVSDLLAKIEDDFKFKVQTPDANYVVERGDSLSVIASRFNTSVSRLVSLNRLSSSNRIQIGQQLLLPQDDSSRVLQSDQMPEDGVYTVTRGDTISTISERFSVVGTELLRLNNIKDPQRIYPGQKLRLPGLYAEAPELRANKPAPATLVTENEVYEEPDSGLEQEYGANQRALGSIVESIDIVSEDSPVVGEQREKGEEETSALVALEQAVDVVEESDEELAESLSTDPADYIVASDDSIEVQATETLGHYADWLALRARDLRRLNDMAYSDPVVVGKRLTLGFSKVSRPEFERRRKDYHSTLQRDFFARYRIRDVEEYTIRRNENIGAIARNRYSAPLWLVRQYNPELDFNRIQIGQKVVFPLLQSVE